MGDIIEMTPNVTKETPVEPEMSLEDCMKAIDIQNQRSKMDDELASLGSVRKELHNMIDATDADDTSFIETKLAEFTMETLEAKIKTPEGLDYFFTNPITGSVLNLVDQVESKDVVGFKKEFLLYLKTSIDSSKGIEEEQKKLDDAQKEFSVDMSQALCMLSDKLFNQIAVMKEKLETIEDTSLRKKAEKEIHYIESGYTFDLFKETLVKYPSIAKHTWEDLQKPVKVSEYGGRYIKKLDSTNTKTSLIMFVGESSEDSLEFKFLIPEDQYLKGRENLFVFSLIRFFSTEGWDANMKKLHSTTVLILKRLFTNDLEPEMKEMVLSNIAEYLSMLYAGIDK